jgi:hypothetical protein
MATKFTTSSYFLRLLSAFTLVFATYNPLKPWSYYEWAIAPALSNFSLVTPVQGLIGIVLLIGWVILLRATSRSLGFFGILLGAALCAAIIWVLVDQGWVSLGVNGVLSWVILAAIAMLLGTGLSWSHIRRRITGQLDVDEVDNE